jgi:hypothetical protein
MLHNPHTLHYGRRLSLDDVFPGADIGYEARMGFTRYAIAAAIVTLTACAGMQQTPALPVTQTPAPPAAQTAAPPATETQSAPSPADEDTCGGSSDLRVTPCHITLSKSAAGPITVTVATPVESKGTITAHDYCGPAGVAKLSQIAADQWTVSAGSSAGTCQVTFSYSSEGDEAGHVILHITNGVRAGDAGHSGPSNSRSK